MKINRDRVDWTQQDIEIARRLGCSREAVRQARPAGAVALHPRKRTTPTVTALLGAMNTSGMTLERAALLARCDKKYAGRILRGLGQEYKRGHKGKTQYDWGKFPTNWKDLTDKEIAVIVGVDDPCVVAQWRHRHGYRKQVPEAVRAGKEAVL